MGAHCQQFFPMTKEVRGLIVYKPFSERTLDTQYRDLLQRTLNDGVPVATQQEVPARRILGHQLRFKLLNGFPVITERDLVSKPEKGQSPFVLAIAELCAFLNGARTVDDMKAFGCGWWGRWATPEKCAKRGLAPGDLGPGSYGPAFRRFPTAEGEPFDQLTHLVEQINELPHLRTHFVSPWIPQYIGRGKGKTQRVVVAPCHGWVHVLIDRELGTLSLHHFQRSADIPVGLVFNFIQYAALTVMLAQVTGYVADELVYTVSDAHIYEGQVNDVLDLLATPPKRLPTVAIDTSVHDLTAFRPTHFTVTDYEPSLPRRVIWTPV